VLIAEKEVENVVEDVEGQELNDTFLLSVPSTSGCQADRSEQKGVSRTGKRKLITNKCPTNNFEQNEEWIVLSKKGIEERKIIFETNKFEKDDPNDPIDTFFKSMASTVKTFSTSLKIRVKREVFNIVNNLELENNDNNDSTSRSNDNSEYSSYSNLSTQSYLSGFTKCNIPTPAVYISPEVTNNQIVGNNCIMQFEENHDEETQL